VLDAENLWLPDWITLPGTALGFVLTAAPAYFSDRSPSFAAGPTTQALYSLLGIAAAAGLVLFIRWGYWLIRRREGIGLGDAKLMALLAAWLGLPQALLAFGLAVLLGALTALVLLALPAAKPESKTWAMSKLPLGTFLCLGGIFSSLWGEPVLAAYLRWAGF
jgi:leader peptidase (prepilin peptidase)/N-methyltransferase